MNYVAMGILTLTMSAETENELDPARPTSVTKSWRVEIRVLPTLPASKSQIPNDKTHKNGGGGGQNSS